MKFLLVFLALFANFAYADQQMIVLDPNDVPADVRADLESKLVGTAPDPGTNPIIDTNADDGDPMIHVGIGEEPWQSQWRQFNIAEGVVTGALALGAISMNTIVKPPVEAGTKGGVWIDDRAREILRGQTPDARANAAMASSVLDTILIAYPIVVDPLLVGLSNPGVNGQTAVQMGLIGIESFAFTGLVTSLTKNLVGRERPYASADCGEGWSADPKCNSSDRFASFFSGHTSYAFTGAGLICSSHQAMEIYGEQSDKAVCWIAIAAAASTGLLRIAADMHYATDVLVGALVGTFSGYVMPKLLHWHSSGASTRQPRTIIAPTMVTAGDGQQGLGLTLIRKF